MRVSYATEVIVALLALRYSDSTLKKLLDLHHLQSWYIAFSARRLWLWSLALMMEFWLLYHPEQSEMEHFKDSQKKNQKMKVCLNILNSCSCIPPSIPPPPPPTLALLLVTPITRCFLYHLPGTCSNKYSFFIDVTRLWNSLPLHLVTSRSPACFKSRLKYCFPFPLFREGRHISRLCYLSNPKIS